MSTKKRPRLQEQQQQQQKDDDDVHLELVVAGCGAGDTAVYHGEASSCFLLRARRVSGGTAAGRRRGPAPPATTTPLLVVDLGFGAQRAIAALCAGGVFPPSTPVYISHNHSDHSAELPVVASVERARRVAEAASGAEAAVSPALDVIAELAVLDKLAHRRLDELLSTGLPLSAFVTMRLVEADRPPLPPVLGGAAAAARRTIFSLDALGPPPPPPLPWELGLWPRAARHSEPCYGFVLYARRRKRPRPQEEEEEDGAAADGGWTPILGWGGDSGADEQHYRALAIAPLAFIDARPGEGTPEHASVAQVLEACRPGGALARCRRVVLYGHGDARARAEAAALVVGAAAANGGGPAVEVAAPGLVVAVPWRECEDGE